MVQFAVAMKDREWTIFRDGEVLRRGISRSRAIEDAAGRARDALETEEEVELLVQDYIGELTRRRVI